MKKILIKTYFLLTGFWILILFGLISWGKFNQIFNDSYNKVYK